MNARPAFVAGPEEPANEPSAEIVLIEGPISDDLALARPVRVDVWRESGEFVAGAAECNVHAFGATPDEAIANLRQVLVEQRQSFVTLQGRLSPSMRREAELLDATIQPRRA